MSRNLKRMRATNDGEFSVSADDSPTVQTKSKTKIGKKARNETVVHYKSRNVLPSTQVGKVEVLPKYDFIHTSVSTRDSEPYGDQRTTRVTPTTPTKSTAPPVTIDLTHSGSSCDPSLQRTPPKAVHKGRATHAKIISRVNRISVSPQSTPVRSRPSTAAGTNPRNISVQPPPQYRSSRSATSHIPALPSSSPIRESVPVSVSQRSSQRLASVSSAPSLPSRPVTSSLPSHERAKSKASLTTQVDQAELQTQKKPEKTPSSTSRRGPVNHPASSSFSSSRDRAPLPISSPHPSNRPSISFPHIPEATSDPLETDTHRTPLPTTGTATYTYVYPSEQTETNLNSNDREEREDGETHTRPSDHSSRSRRRPNRRRRGNRNQPETYRRSRFHGISPPAYAYATEETPNFDFNPLAGGILLGIPDPGEEDSDTLEGNEFNAMVPFMQQMMRALGSGAPNSRSRGRGRAQGVSNANLRSMLDSLNVLNEVVQQREMGLTGDIDNYSYEQLLELEDRIGKVNTGVKASELEYLENRKVFDGDGEVRCTICLEEYKKEVELTVLKCDHTFHISCMEAWAKDNNSCPLCKTEIVKRE